MNTPTLLNNRYKLLGVLGGGGFGETFLAEDTQMPSGRRCVIKQLKPVVDNPQVYQLVQDRFQREAAILEELGDGSNQIPKLYAYFIENGQFYLVQEYIEGHTLTQIVQQQGLMSETSVKDILINILPILNYVHSKRMVHRDIKPDNILIRSFDSKPVLIDFGAVKETMGTVVTPSGNSSRSIVIGTPGYMPMEQTAGRPVFASDIYSLGLTAIYLLTGKIPQQLATDPATGEILWRPHALNVSPSFTMVLDKAIQQSPRDRYLNARDMLAALQSGSTPVAPTVPVFQNLVHTVPAPGQYVQQPPTINHQPPTNNQQPTINNQQQVSYPQPTTSQNQNGLGTWQQAVILGSVIGVFIVGGWWMMEIFRNNSSEQNQSVTRISPSPITSTSPSVTPSINSQPISISTPGRNVISDSPTPIITSSPETTPIVLTPTNASISQTAAVEVLKNWITAKREIFAPPYRTDIGEQLLTGKAYRDNIKKTDDPDLCLANGSKEEECLSSVDWLQRNNAHYNYGVQSLDAVKNFKASGDQATIEVEITEERTLIKDGKADPTNTSFDTLLVRYSLESENGQVKIADYKTVRTLRKS
ncbi:serine/threonine protein kinase [Fischerella muscicola CCMEE 5323]|uniref:non-specific serine/threonine protein kinase n=1 Tax=Fischerella muscicola CCMEE 5323 TaxID=2019572 RepID=A0A2N6K736_FISMU|nr:IMS domain-containing protein [Fischerella muscicola]PLZ93019.1 serine/threonine protein kinase [Fischerella muscicola CCMEE 5323]